jgi:protein tyrosine phosphatase
LAQDPLGPETAFDFWRMINDHNAYTVIMLSNEDNFTPAEKVHSEYFNFNSYNLFQYWPVDTSVNEYLGQKQELILQLVSEEKYPNFNVRRLHYCFKVKMKQKLLLILFQNVDSSRGREILQYVVKLWPNNSHVPSNIHAFLDLIGHVLHRQSNIPDAGPIILHCR